MGNSMDNSISPFKDDSDIWVRVSHHEDWTHERGKLARFPKVAINKQCSPDPRGMTFMNIQA